jgi:hypothetical protein
MRASCAEEADPEDNCPNARGATVCFVLDLHKNVRCFLIKVYYQSFLGALIDLIVELLGLIMKPFDNQTES